MQCDKHHMKNAMWEKITMRQMQCNKCNGKNAMEKFNWRNAM